jgi:integrase
MRRQEILNLKIPDIVIANGVASVLIRTSKSGQPRAIPASSEMLSVVARQSSNSRLEGDDRLFSVLLTTVKRKLTLLWKQTGLGDVRLHDLRRTHATILCSNGVDMRTVAGRLGHSDTKMLMSTYAVYQEALSGTNKLNEAFIRFS